MATLLHNLEELLTVQVALDRPPLAPLLARWGVPASRAWSAFQLLNWTVSGAAITAVVFAVRRGRPELAGVLSGAMLANVLVPHVPAALQARGYAPGVVTAVLLVLPVTGRYLLLADSEDLLTGEELRQCLLVGVGLVVVGVPVGLIAADRVVQRSP